MKRIIIFFVSILGLIACNKTAQKQTTEEKKVSIPLFSADSAYSYIQKQVDFGPRVPNTQAHISCAEYLANTLQSFGAQVLNQQAELTAFDGTKLNAVNIIGSFQPENKNRILLFAHWDSRPWADQDPDPNNRTKPIAGANDGASGVGVLLEIARQIGAQQPEVGVDIIFFDAEDYGAPEHLSNAETQHSWCLGSQYWANNPHIPGYKARYGILLDMVGAHGATFYREQVSEYYASHVLTKVWKKANELGFSNYFLNMKGGAITDDHLYINQIIKIPSIDIIQRDINSPYNFGNYWHTVNDTMDNIDKNTLYAVGTTLLNVIYNEK